MLRARILKNRLQALVGLAEARVSGKANARSRFFKMRARSRYRVESMVVRIPTSQMSLEMASAPYRPFREADTGPGAPRGAACPLASARLGRRSGRPLPSRDAHSAQMRARPRI